MKKQEELLEEELLLKQQEGEIVLKIVDASKNKKEYAKIATKVFNTSYMEGNKTLLANMPQIVTRCS